MQPAAAVVIAISATPVLFAQAAWTRLYPQLSPPARYNAMTACRETTGDVLVLFGNSNPTGSLRNDCWLFDGSYWSQRGGLPPVRMGGAMVYDAARDRVVLFGGVPSSAPTALPLADTWEWDGVTWSIRSTPVAPPARYNHGMAYDRKRNVTVVFGGIGSGTWSLGDLWEWDGTVWTQPAMGQAPAGRQGDTMCFDPSRENVLLWKAGLYWSWDGTNWFQYQPAVPPAGENCSADLHRRRVVMPFANGDQFAWEWDGAQWAIQLQASPAYRTGALVEYDPVRRRTVVFGGLRNGATVDETWVFGTPTPADVLPYEAGCPGTAGIPGLEHAPYSYPWLGDTTRNRVVNVAPNCVGALFATGLNAMAPLSLGGFGMPGCNLLVSMPAAEFHAAAAGIIEWSLAVPNTGSLLGARLYQQAFPFDPGANQQGLTATNGVVMTTGLR
jgi:hypothetical protein